jgi:hypothetical protein
MRMKNWKPIIIENSSIPVWLSKITPISIGAITLGFIVICRGEISDVERRHEEIHFQQFLETVFLGFIFLYFFDYARFYLKHKNGEKAYRSIRAEKEAFENEDKLYYLKTRKRWRWIFS